MPLYKKESLEDLRGRVDLVEVISSHIKLQRAGAYYKALCPFHEEKSPSFIVQPGNPHYHCYGCGAHGDAISFLMNHLHFSFVEAVETLAERFGVILLTSKEEISSGKRVLKEVLDKAARFYHYYLLHTEEGHYGLRYLYNRGIDLDFIRTFQFGYAPKTPALFQKWMKEQKVVEEDLLDTGLVKIDSQGRKRDFFTDRVLIPLHDVTSAVIGFTARKICEETFGPKYINTPETPLFKKSRVLFALSYSRKRIAKEKRAIVVEGQIDALRLIHCGFNFVVASQGTAFTQEHANELIQLGVRQVYLAFDSDEAGGEAAVKVGDLFQKKGIEALVVLLPDKGDPDSILRDQGPKVWQNLLDSAIDYLTFLVQKFSKNLSLSNPSQKNELIQMISDKVRMWDQPLMVHESLKKLARLTQVPEQMLVQNTSIPPIFTQTSSRLSKVDIDPDRILEADFLRLLFLFAKSQPNLLSIAKTNLTVEHFYLSSTKRLYQQYLDHPEMDLLSFTIDLENPEDQILLSEILAKKVNPEKVVESFVYTVQKILDRQWMAKREEIKRKMLQQDSSEENLSNLAKQFDQIKNERPKVVCPLQKTENNKTSLEITQDFNSPI